MTAVHVCSEDGFINTVILGNGWKKHINEAISRSSQCTVTIHPSGKDDMSAEKGVSNFWSKMREYGVIWTVYDTRTLTSKQVSKFWFPIYYYNY